MLKLTLLLLAAPFVLVNAVLDSAGLAAFAADLAGASEEDKVNALSQQLVQDKRKQVRGFRLSWTN